MGARGVPPFSCETICEQLVTKRNDINKLKLSLMLLLNNLTKKLNHNVTNYLHFLDVNYVYCSYIMKTNIYIKNLIRLNEIISNCKTLYSN